jgi:hypothetical protein
MIQIIIKQYDGWFGVLELADLWGIIDLDETMELIDSAEHDVWRDSSADEREEYCLNMLAQRGVLINQ